MCLKRMQTCNEKHMLKFKTCVRCASFTPASLSGPECTRLCLVFLNGDFKNISISVMSFLAFTFALVCFCV